MYLPGDGVLKVGFGMEDRALLGQRRENSGNGQIQAYYPPWRPWYRFGGLYRARQSPNLTGTLWRTGEMPAGPLSRPTSPRRTPITTTALPFKIQLGPSGTARLRLIA